MVSISLSANGAILFHHTWGNWAQKLPRVHTLRRPGLLISTELCLFAPVRNLPPQVTGLNPAGIDNGGNESAPAAGSNGTSAKSVVSNLLLYQDPFVFTMMASPDPAPRV